MATDAASSGAPRTFLSLPNPDSASFRWLCLAIGAFTWLLSVGGRWDIALAAWFAPIFLLRFLRDSTPVVGLGLCWLVSVAGCVYWGVQLGIPIQLSWLISLVYGTIFSLPFFADRLLTPRMGVIGKLLVFPAAYAAIEWIMGSFSPLGTSSGLRAISQTENLPLLQLVAVTGPYGIGFLINSLGTTANLLWERPASAKAHKAAIVYGVILLIVLFGGAARMAFSAPPEAYVRMAGITPSMHAQEAARSMIEGRQPGTGDAIVDPDVIKAATGLFESKEELAETDPKVTQAAFNVVYDDLLASTRAAAQAGAKVVIWSETAASVASQADLPELLAKVGQVAREENIYINVAVGQPFSRNQTHLVGPDGNPVWSYDKNYPVPVLEPVEPRMSPVPVAQTPFGRLSSVICFDGDFPALNRVNSDIMIIPGFDWPEVGRMHTLKAARLRAIENGYALIRIAYHSQSAAFDRLGNVLATQDTTGPDAHIMYADVPAKGARTLYNRTGDVLGWMSFAGIIAAIAFALFRRKTS
tara:strand:- start:16860 stop:18443 length:1584 start_codon:yes stop_codon:yes gene_type:complete